MAKIGVGGGAGFIGSHLVDRLIKNGHQVFVIDDLSGGKIENLSHLPDNKVNLQQADCRDEKSIDLIFKKFKPEIFFALQANASENKAQFSPIDITSRNYDAFIKVLTPFIKYNGRRFIFTSSIAVYGAIQTPFLELDRPEPEDLYGITKLAAEKTLKIMSQVHGFEYVIARPHNVYGPRQNMSDPYRNVVTIWMNAILRGEKFYIYGNGEQKRCFSYIDDVVEALYKCGFSDVNKMTFNIGSDNRYTVNQLAEALRSVVGKITGISYLPERPQEVKEAISDHSLAKKYLQYEDKTPLLQGLAKTWEWAQSMGPQERKYTEIEIDSPLIPSNWREQK